MPLNCSVGGRESTSMITVVEADAILELMPDDTTEWDNLETPEKEFRLELAARMVGMLSLRGRRAYQGQAMPFPRTVQSKVHEIPDDIKRAQALMAYSIVHSALNSRPEVSEGAASGSSVSRVSLGGLLSVSFEGKSPSSGTVFDVISRNKHFPIFMLMNPWIAQIRAFNDPLDATTLSTTTTTIAPSTTTSQSTP